jgi:2-polyprenyl-3-methyl-5-hydroxy-6-metoxy-1,4-benzoquinol methylase
VTTAPTAHPADDVARYAELQRAVYDTHSVDRAGAEGMVAADYGVRREQAHFQAQWVVNEYLRRRPDPAAPIDFELRLLDFGCGVGRLMEAFVELGFANVDGVDISARMIEHAAASPLLDGSRFWVTDGHDCGDAPTGGYDIAYSFICLNHVSMRQTRIDIFRSLARCLKPGGCVVLELFTYPTIDAARIPFQHVPWRANRPSPGTNSEADVWVTPDQFGEVYDDIRLSFRDICLQEIDVWDNPAVPTGDARYPLRRNVLLVSASTDRGLVNHYWGDRPERAF